MTSPGSGSPNLLLYSPPGSPDADADGTPTPTLTPTVTPTPTPPTTCAATRYTGSLAATGASRTSRPMPASPPRPPARTRAACAARPGVDFDLYLQRLSGTTWVVVATGLGATASETVTYNGAPGTYRWRVYAYSGSGAYTLGQA